MNQRVQLYSMGSANSRGSAKGASFSNLQFAEKLRNLGKS